ncbi:MAG: TonB-dependent receptor domain-containing protein [bacterium]
MLSFNSRKCLLHGAFTHFILLLLFLGLFAAKNFANAQTNGTITGTIIDDRTGEALPGTNVFIKGTTLGSAADLEGTFTVRNVPPGNYTLIAAFVGYHSQEISVNVVANEETRVNFSLKISALQMDEIVVTGTGYELKKKELTTAIATINSDEIEASPVESIDHLLQGRIAGGSVNMNSGSPGTGTRIRLRGITSANASLTPVIYIDGVRVDNNDNFRLEQQTGGLQTSVLSDILIGDIERIEVTKGGAASTLYGSEAASGVIQIFTKKGKAGKAKATFKVEQGVNSPETKFVIEDFTKDEVLSSGYYQKYSASLDGGSEKLTYHLSGHVLDSEGVLPKNDETQYSFRAGVRTFPAEKFQIDFSAGLIRDDYERMFNNNAIADLYGTIEGFDSQFFGPNVTDEERKTLVREYSLPNLTYAVNRFNFGTTASWDPIKYFSTRLTLGMDYRKNEERQFIPIEAEIVTSTPGGGLFRSDREFLTLTIDYAGTIKYPMEGPITSTFTVGGQGFREEDRESQVSATSFGLPGTDDFDNAANLAPLESNQEIFSGGFYFNEQLGLWNKLFLNAGVRFDGNTAFGDEVDLEAFPKFGAAYNISDEAFWQKLPWNDILNQLKFRFSWGKTGSFPNPFTRDKTFTQGAFLQGVAVNFGNPGDASLAPEKTRTIEVGLDAALLNDRIGVEFTVFDEKTTDALFRVPSQPATGLGFQLRNVGTIENDGIELAINATVIESRNFRFSLRGSYSTLDNEVTSLGGAQPFSSGGFGFLPQRVEEGHPVGVFRTNKPVPNPETGELDGDFDTVFEFSPTADKYYSISANFTIFRNLELSVLGDGQSGANILNTGSVIRFFNGGEPQASKVPANYSFFTASHVFVEDASYFKIREINASYRLPQKYFGTQLTFFANIRNVLTFADNDDLDPELHGITNFNATSTDVGGLNFFTLPAPRQFRFGVLVGL